MKKKEVGTTCISLLQVVVLILLRLKVLHQTLVERRGKNVVGRCIREVVFVMWEIYSIFSK